MTEEEIRRRIGAICDDLEEKRRRLGPLRKLALPLVLGAGLAFSASCDMESDYGAPLPQDMRADTAQIDAQPGDAQPADAVVKTDAKVDMGNAGAYGVPPPRDGGE